MNALNLLRQQGFSELACQFAGYIGRQQPEENPLVTLTAGLLSEAVSSGHVCLNLAAAVAADAAFNTLLPPPEDWQQQLQHSPVVGQPGEFKPLIITDGGLLYLYRHWQDEQQVAAAIRQRAQTVMAIADNPQLQQFFQQWPSQVTGIDWQKVAVLSALQQQMTVISGGPGTGKTTVVVRILQALHCLDSTDTDANSGTAQLRIALAAPTGKAAARLQQAVNDVVGEQYQAKTLHRLLGISARQDQGRYSADRPLPLDVLIVDEASMIDISLMALIFKALPAHARLILLGDADQLASVESGAVLASLCAQRPTFSPAFAKATLALTGIELPGSTDQPLQDSLIKLQHSYRFAAGGPVGQLATAVNLGDADRLLATLQQTTPPQLRAFSPTQLQASLQQGYQAYIAAVEQHQDPVKCLQAFEQFRVLAATRQGPQSLQTVNQLMSQLLSRRGWRSQQPYYQGRPIMVTQNDYRQQLFNGDIGLILADAEGQLQAWFLFAGSLRQVSLSRLPAHETVYAMTVHKSQGSEFDEVLLLLPEDDSSLLSRELIYTAITRARQQVSVMASQPVLQRAVQRRHMRESGLQALLSVDSGQVLRQA